MVTKLGGVLCALVTPMDEQGGLDLGGLDRLVDRVVGGGVDGICPVGSSGEGSRLTAEQRCTVVARVRARVPDDYPVVPGPSPVVPGAVIEEIASLHDAGADAVLLAPPPMYALPDADIQAYFDDVASRSALPVVLYHFPDLIGVGIAPAVVGKLARHERIIGVKDSSRQLEHTQALLYETAPEADFAVLTGSDTLLLATVVLGGAGAIAAASNLVPELAADLYRKAVEQDWPAARELQQRLFDVVTAVRAAGFPAGWKAALELCGVCSGYPVPPATPARGDKLAALQAKLTELGVC